MQIQFLDGNNVVLDEGDLVKYENTFMDWSYGTLIYDIVKGWIVVNEDGTEKEIEDLSQLFKVPSKGELF